MSNVDHPAHYTSGSIETIDHIRDMLTGEGFEGYLVGNILKYMARYRNKNGVEDLRKADWYLNELIRTKVNEERKNDHTKMLDDLMHGCVESRVEMCERIVDLEDLVRGLEMCGDDDADAHDCPLYDESEPYRCKKDRLMCKLGIGEPDEER